MRLGGKKNRRGRQQKPPLRATRGGMSSIRYRESDRTTGGRGEGKGKKKKKKGMREILFILLTSLTSIGHRVARPFDCSHAVEEKKGRGGGRKEKGKRKGRQIPL